MGWFNTGGTPSSSDIFTKQEAFLGIALATSAADGVIDDSETKNISAYLTQMKMFDEYSERGIRDIFEKLFKVLEKEGIGGLVAIAKSSLPDDLRETAFTCAVDIAIADGVIEENENALLQELQHVLDISDELGGKILDVMVIKNRA